MLYPSIFGENLFDDFFRFPDFGRDVEKKLYGKHAAQVMKTDVHEHDDHYEIVIDLPGFKKDQINLELQNGYLTVSAAKGLDKDEKTEKGKLIRQERYAGAMQRSFYIGDTVTEADVKAKFPAMYNAFCYGAPPHAGIAPGVDRMIMLICGEESIREIIPFPMNKNAMDIMMGAPGTVEQKQLDELHLAITAKPEE